MKKQRKKVEEFQTGLKVGDKIITTGGIYGLITKVNDTSVQIQIADKVRIEVARASVGGYQGQAPVVQEAGNP
jgi:preprotein translocase subunit YajC